MPREHMRVGAIDIGSNSVRLLVADFPVTNGGAAPLVTIARAGESCRLGRGLHESGRIDEEVGERAAVVAAEFVRRARSLDVRHLVIGATAALRSASNGEEVAGLIAGRCGMPVRILTGDEEAQLVYRSVVLGLGGSALASQCIVFDLGGGSTEIVSGVGARAGRWRSLPIGAVSLTERFLHHDPAAPDELEAARAHVREVLMHDCALLPGRTPLLAGVGGTVTVLASMDRGLMEHEPALIDGWAVTAARAKLLIDRILGASHDERRSFPIMGEGRADIVGAGALVVMELLARFQAPGVVCSTQGLRYGLARLAAEEAAAGQ